MIKISTNGGGAVSSFQWSTSEQVWPFEKAADGKTIYAKMISDTLYNGTGNWKLVNMNVPTLFSLEEVAGFVLSYGGTTTYQTRIPHTDNENSTVEITEFIDLAAKQFKLWHTNAVWNNQPIKYYIKYTKSA